MVLRGMMSLSDSHHIRHLHCAKRNDRIAVLDYVPERGFLDQCDRPWVSIGMVTFGYDQKQPSGNWETTQLSLLGINTVSNKSEFRRPNTRVCTILDRLAREFIGMLTIEGALFLEQPRQFSICDNATQVSESEIALEGMLFLPDKS